LSAKLQNTGRAHLAIWKSLKGMLKLHTIISLPEKIYLPLFEFFFFLIYKVNKVASGYGILSPTRKTPNGTHRTK